MDLEEYRNQVVPFDRTLHRIFSNLVEVQVSPWMDTPCWVYKRHYERGQDRYYMRSLDGKDGGLVHRYLYQKLVEELPIDDIYHVAHLCHQKSCNRVDGHLLAVKPRENVLAVDGPKGCYAENYYKTECVKGHPYTDENTSYSYLGSRICRQCYEDGKKARWRSENGSHSNKPDLDRVAKIIELYKDGCYTAEIARIVNISAGSVGHALMKYYPEGYKTVYTANRQAQA